MRTLRALALGIACAAVIACAGRSARPAATMPTAGASDPATASPGDAHAQLDALDQQIEQDLAAMGLPSTPPPACAGSCARPTADTMSSVQPATADPTCQPGPSEACQSACTLSDSICANAGKICEIATQLGGDDAYANTKCTRGTESCTVARGKCCGCQL